MSPQSPLVERLQIAEGRLEIVVEALGKMTPQAIWFEVCSVPRRLASPPPPPYPGTCRSERGTDEFAISVEGLIAIVNEAKALCAEAREVLDVPDR